jgi:hypothetical protein
MSHGDQLQSLPPNFVVIAHTPTSPWTAIAHESKPIFGVQFHPEVSHSPKGKEVIGGFVKNICGIKGGWSMVGQTFLSVSVVADVRTRSSPRRLLGLGRFVVKRAKLSVPFLEVSTRLSLPS